jgi:protein phosphatase
VSPTPRTVAVAFSEAGLVRPGNEDAFLAAADLGVYAVADGMGGAACGEVAARMTVDAVRAAVEDPNATWPSGSRGAPPAGSGLPLLVAGVERANARVHAAAAADRAKAGMGSTFTGILFFDGGAAIAHVGDSRAWRLRAGRLESLTVDHTLVREAVDGGEMTPEEARTSKYRHVITRAIGTHPAIKVDRALLDVEAGDVYLLATDGLHGVVGDDEIAAILQAEPDLHRAASHLMVATFDAGAPDNVTLVLLRVLDASGAVAGHAHG